MGKELNKAMWYGASALTTVFAVAYGVDCIVYNGPCQNPSDLPTNIKGGTVSFDTSPGCEYQADKNAIQNNLAVKLGVPDYSIVTGVNNQKLPTYEVSSNGHTAIEFNTANGIKLMAVPTDVLVETTLESTSLVPKKDKLRGNIAILLGSILSTSLSFVIALSHLDRKVKYSSHRSSSDTEGTKTNAINLDGHNKNGGEAINKPENVIVPEPVNEVDLFKTFIDNLMKKYPNRHRHRRRKNIIDIK